MIVPQRLPGETVSSKPSIRACCGNIAAIPRRATVTWTAHSRDLYCLAVLPAAALIHKLNPAAWERGKVEHLSGGEMVARALEDEDVEFIFGYPGGAVLHIYDALFKNSEIPHILVRHEQAATHAADGYARATGKPGVVLVTSGPGATNAITGIATAYMDSIPIVVFFRPGAIAPDWPGRLPGNRYGGYLPAGSEAQLPGEKSRRHSAGDQESVSYRHHWPPWTGGD